MLKGRGGGIKPVNTAPVDRYRRVVSYLSNAAALPELREENASQLADGLPDLLDVLAAILAEAQSELLREAHERLLVCREILMGAG